MNRRQFTQTAMATGMTTMTSALSGCGISKDTESNLTSTSMTGPNNRIQISNDTMSLTLFPSHGGSISGLEYKGFPLLRAAPATDHDILDVANFPIVPIVNRIPDGEFEFRGQNVKLTPNLLDLPDFFHGQGWRSSWQASEQKDNFVQLTLHHKAGEWPWAYIATQNFHLLENGLRMEIGVKNLSDSPMPAGLGFHPYFLRSKNTVLKTAYEGHWATNERLHPKSKVQGPYSRDWNAGDFIEDTVTTDVTHYGFGGTAVMTEAGRPTIEITADPQCDNLHIYSPVGENFICIEPVTDRADPFNEEPSQINILNPGEEFSVWMQIVASDPV